MLERFVDSDSRLKSRGRTGMGYNMLIVNVRGKYVEVTKNLLESITLGHLAHPDTVIEVRQQR